MSSTSRSLNALKHGGYSNLGVLPGEDPAEFDRFHQRLIDEYRPSGPTEDDAVLSLAKCLWRKSRLQVYARAVKAREDWAEVFGPNALSSDIDDNLMFMACKVADRTNEMLQSEIHQRARQERRNIERASAERSKILLAFLRAHDENVDEYLKQGHADFSLAELGSLVTHESLIQEIELAARLDARIDRLVKRLFQLKAMKPMVGLCPKPPASSRDDRSSDHALNRLALTHATVV